jgi:hypothetical protein
MPSPHQASEASRVGLLEDLASSNLSYSTMATTNKDAETPVTVRKLSVAAEDVREAIEVEHSLTFFEAVKLYPKAIGWSMYFSLGVIMLGRSFGTYCPLPFSS